MKSYSILLSLVFFSTASFAQPLPQEIPGNYIAGSSFYHHIKDYATLNNDLVFVSDNQLWFTDGTINNTVALKSFALGSTPFGLKKWNNKLYFIANDSLHGNELWVTDGTISGTTLVMDISPGATSAFEPYFIQTPFTVLQIFNNKLWFAADDATHGRELWMSDGISTGTSMFFDLNTGTGDGVPDQKRLCVAGSNLYFAGFRDTVTLNGIFVTDGIVPGATCLLDTLYPPANWLIPFGDKLIFSATDIATTNDMSIYLTDGTPPGTNMLYYGRSNTNDHAVLNNKLYFFTKLSQAQPYALCETDGTPAGTHEVEHTVYAVSSNHSNSRIFFLDTMQNKLIFHARGNSDTCGVELYESNGTTGGATQIKDLRPGQYTSFPYGMTSLNNEMYFQAWNDDRVNVWRTDGTANGTQPILPSAANATIGMYLGTYQELRHRPIIAATSSLYFYAKYDNTLGFRLYKLDVFPTGVQHEQKLSTIDIYPNPSQGFINVEAKNAASISIHSITGSLIYRKDINPSETTLNVDVHQFPPGTYTVTTLLTDGTIRSAKFAKQ